MSYPPVSEITLFQHVMPMNVILLGNILQIVRHLGMVIAIHIFMMLSYTLIHLISHHSNVLPSRNLFPSLIHYPQNMFHNNRHLLLGLKCANYFTKEVKESKALSDLSLELRKQS